MFLTREEVPSQQSSPHQDQLLSAFQELLEVSLNRTIIKRFGLKPHQNGIITKYSDWNYSCSFVSLKPKISGDSSHSLEVKYGHLSDDRWEMTTFVFDKGREWWCGHSYHHGDSFTTISTKQIKNDRLDRFKGFLIHDLKAFNC